MSQVRITDEQVKQAKAAQQQAKHQRGVEAMHAIANATRKG